jgi:hypothetical protein
MNRIFFILFLITCTAVNAQVGIGTTTPEPSALLDVNADNLPADAKKGLMPPKMTQAERDNISSPAVGLMVYNTTTNRVNFWSGSEWLNINGSTAETDSIGDVKQGFQSADHEGWIKLDGRALSTLSASQQAKATSLGFTTNLPDATHAFLVQNGTTLGSVSSSNTKTIEQANIPNYNSPTATTSTNGNHNHSIQLRRTNQNFSSGSGNVFGNTTGSIFSLNTNSSGDHSHTVTVNSGGSGVPLDITPKSLSINIFIYLGT